MIKVTIEFKSVDETIVALAKLVPPVVKKEMTNPDALKPLAELVGAPEKAPSVSSVAKQGAIPVAAPASDNAPTTQRKGRADKGKLRGPRKNVAGVGSGIAPQPDSQVQGAGTPFDSASRPDASLSPAAPETAAPDAGTTLAPAVATAAPDAATLTPQQTIEAIYEKRGVEGAMQFLSRYGVKRVRELKPEQHAEFVKHGAAVLAGGEI